MPFSSASSSSASSSSSAAMAAANAASAMVHSSGPSEVEGYLNKKGRMTWKKRYFVLHGTVISYYAKKGDPKFRNQMALTAQSTFSESSSKKNGFSIVTSGKGFQLNAETPEEKQAWTRAVTSAIRSLQRQPPAAPSTSSASSSSSSSSGSGSSRPTQQQLSQGVVVGGKMKKDTKTFYVVGTEFVLDARYELIKPIGHGAYGVVISATDAQLGQKVAIKKCPNAFEDLVDAKRIVREIRLLMHFRHENIVRVLDLQAPPVADFDDVYIISELMDTDLHRVIYSRQKLTDDHVQFFLYQMLCALKYIHSAKVIHRDLKPSNILLNSNCDLKICDFGLSRGVCPVGEQEASDLTEYVVTRWYRAPEIMLSCPEYTTAIDVWAVGCIFGEMLGRKPLFPGNDYIHQLKLITKLLGTPSAEELAFVTNHKARRFMLNLPKEPQSSLSSNLQAKYPDASPEALALLRRMLVIDPAKRITVAEALEMPYLSSLHDPVVEIVADSDVHWGDIESCELSKVNLQRQILEDMIRFHPEAKSFLRDRRVACGLPPEERLGEGSSRGVGAGVASRPEGLSEDAREEGGGRKAALKVDGLADRLGRVGVVGNGGGREGGREEVDDGTDDHGLKRATEGGAEAKIAAARAAAGTEGLNR